MTPPFNPIFILGITKRSGTNYLRDVLCLHPDCYGPGPIWENYALDHAELLTLYSRFTANHWPKKWQVTTKLPPSTHLPAYLGQGFLEFLSSQILNSRKVQFDPQQLPFPPNLRLVTKSPSVDNLPYFFELFPQTQVLIVIRDGRAVTESCVKSFGRSYETAMREWDEAAKTILAFDQKYRGSSHPYLIVKYEDLFQDLTGELCRILAFLKLDEAKFPFDHALNLPIRGSSELTQTGHLHWQAVEKKQNFNPTQRFKHWRATTHDRFNWVAGASQRALGYDLSPTALHPLQSTVRNVILDAFWRPIWPLRQAARKLRYMLMSSS